MIYTVEFNNLFSILKIIDEGDTIFIKDGIYYNQNIILSFKGNVNKRIYITAKNPGSVIFKGQTQITINGEYITFGNFIFNEGGITNGINIMGYENRITNCIFNLNSSNGPIMNIYGKNNRVDHCIFENFSKNGVWVEIKRTEDIDYILVDHNIFKNRSPGQDNGFETIRIGTSSSSLTKSRTIIYSNLFEGCNGELEIISVKSSENIIYKNIFKNSKGTLSLRHGDRSIVAYNKFIQNNIPDTGGIRVSGKNHIIFRNLLKNINGNDNSKAAISLSSGIKNSPLNGYFQVRRLQVIENIFINNLYDIAIGIEKDNTILPPEYVYFVGNIIFKNTTNPIFSYKGIQTDKISYQKNQYYGYDFGKKLDNNATLLDPKSFKINIKEDEYGTKNKIGTVWKQNLQYYELDINVDEFYFINKDYIYKQINNVNITPILFPSDYNDENEYLLPNNASTNDGFSSLLLFSLFAFKIFKKIF